MQKTDWTALAAALKQCLNGRGTLQYNYDARLSQMIEPSSPKNDQFTPKRDYNTQDREETCEAIDRWVKAQEDMENTCIITHAQLELQEDDAAAKEKILPKLIEEKKIFVRGVTSIVDNVSPFPGGNDARQDQAKALFNIAVMAIEEFQKTPTALVLFPNLTIPDSRVFGGFYGSPWSTFNMRSLRMKFRMINPHFQIHVCTVSERKGSRHFDPDSRKVGIAFTYISPW
jgi:hypothetical protein